jgi:hypothetical protein
VLREAGSHGKRYRESHQEWSLFCKCATAEPVSPLTANHSGCRHFPAGRTAAQPSGGGAPVRWFQRPKWLPAVESRERAEGGGGFSCRARRRESHVTSTGCLCYFHRGRGKGRLHISPEPVARPGGAAVRCRLPVPLHPRKHAVVGRLKDEIPSSTSKYTQKYTPWAYIFEPLLNPLPRRGRQPGARGRAASPPTCLPTHTATPCTPPNSLKQITGCATESWPVHRLLGPLELHMSGARPLWASSSALE